MAQNVVLYWVLLDPKGRVLYADNRKQRCIEWLEDGNSQMNWKAFYREGYRVVRGALSW